MLKSVSNVEEYIAGAPEKLQSKLSELRKVIKQIAPKAEERISYGMPYYGYKGRLVYFAIMKNHIGLYIPPPIIEQHKYELKNYVTTKSAIHFPLDKEFPFVLIKKLIKARIKWNDETWKKT
jgi:uncharacterized protein YdhG (YjbR/CyaY superfamily)